MPCKRSGSRRGASQRGASQRDASQRGLTLVELLVAISVLAVVAVMGWRGLDTIVRARQALNADLSQTRGMQLTFAQLENDCARLADRDLVAGRAVVAVQPGVLRLVRLVPGYAQPSQVQVVTYRLTDGALTRRESTPTRSLEQLDALWAAAAEDTDTVNPAVVLQDQVGAMTLRLWADDNKGWRDAQSTQPGAASAGLAATSPGYTGLEISLTLRERERSMQKILLLGVT